MWLCIILEEKYFDLVINDIMYYVSFWYLILTTSAVLGLSAEETLSITLIIFKDKHIKI